MIENDVKVGWQTKNKVSFMSNYLFQKYDVKFREFIVNDKSNQIFQNMWRLPVKSDDKKQC